MAARAASIRKFHRLLRQLDELGALDEHLHRYLEIIPSFPERNAWLEGQIAHIRQLHRQAHEDKHKITKAYRIPEGLALSVKRVAKARDMSPSNVVADALRGYLKASA